MSVYIFAGPTLSADEGQQELDAIYFPPVSQGDVYRAALTRPTAIGIIDGYFERVPAVWHKEILWAMSQGIHVYGSASMGALRAAELSVFGMKGIGRIFQAYSSGELEDDDEVAVTHALADDGYHVHSEAMVNIRATLDRAVSEKVISPAAKRLMEREAKGLFYPDRTYGRLLELAAAHETSAADLQRFREWLPDGRVDQKREDALRMLRTMRDDLSHGLGRQRVRFTFESTVYWLQATRRDGRAPAPTGNYGAWFDGVLDELRLDHGAFSRALSESTLRYLALEEAGRQGWTVTPEAVSAQSERFRSRLGLDDHEFSAWLNQNGLDDARFADLMSDEILLMWTRRLIFDAAVRLIPDHLRVTGAFHKRSARAAEKALQLSERGLDGISAADAGISLDDVVQWFFERKGRPIPADLGQYAADIGFDGEMALIHAIFQEWCFASITSERNPEL